MKYYIFPVKIFCLTSNFEVSKKRLERVEIDHAPIFVHVNPVGENWTGLMEYTGTVEIPEGVSAFSVYCTFSNIGPAQVEIGDHIGVCEHLLPKEVYYAISLS